MTDVYAHGFEAIVYKIFEGEYDTWLHQAALRCYVSEIVKHSGIMPIIYNIQPHVKQGHSYKVIRDV